MPDRLVSQITDAAYHLNGIRNPKTADDDYALFIFQDMLSVWSIDGLIVPWYVTENFTLTAGKAVYTIGVTGDSPDLITATGRPIRIMDAFIRISDDDYPVDVDMTKQEYAGIVSKDTEERPKRLYYDPQYPNGKIKFNAECDVAYDFHLISEKALVDVTAITDTLSLPLGINEALSFNLALRLAIGSNNKLSDDTRRIAKESKDALETRNAIEKLSGPVGLDSAIVGGGGRMDFESGE